VEVALYLPTWGLINTMPEPLIIFNDLPRMTGSLGLLDAPPFTLWTLPDSVCEESDARPPTRT
jgi:hypothetical protein